LDTRFGLRVDGPEPGWNERFAAGPLNSEAGCGADASRFGQDAQNYRLEAGSTRAKTRLGFRESEGRSDHFIDLRKSGLIKPNRESGRLDTRFGLTADGPGPGWNERFAAGPLNSEAGCGAGASRFGQDAQNYRLEAGSTLRNAGSLNSRPNSCGRGRSLSGLIHHATL
jgi:hypothetical protein